MQFVLYSEMTVSQCLTAVNTRMHAKATSTRPALDGWVEKSGSFALGVSTNVIGKFSRQTYLKAKVERESGITIIRGNVPSGVSKEGQLVVFGALAALTLGIIGSGTVLFGLLMIPFAAYLYIPMRGDFENSEILLDEVFRTLKAKPNPPKSLTKPTKKPTEPKAAKSAARSAAPRSRKQPADDETASAGLP